jgi:Rieske Fe-S protein
MSRLLGNLIKGALGFGALYVAYKVGESMGKDKDKNLIQSAKNEIDSEIQFVTDLINDYKNKPNKTKKDRDNMDLLNIKLEQLKRQK